MIPRIHASRIIKEKLHYTILHFGYYYEVPADTKHAIIRQGHSREIGIAFPRNGEEGFGISEHPEIYTATSGSIRKATRREIEDESKLVEIP